MDIQRKQSLHTSLPWRATLAVARLFWVLVLWTSCQGTWPAPRAVTTMVSAGLYWSPVGGGPDTPCEVRYRPLGDSAWTRGFPLWFDVREWQYRGSLVHLRPATTYEVDLVLGETGAPRRLQLTTQADTFPIADTVFVPSSHRPLRVTRGGRPEGYVLYMPPPGDSGLIDVQDRFIFCVNVKADYVILRGFTFRGAAIHGVRIGRQHHVVVEQCDIATWGRPHPRRPGYGAAHDAAIYGEGNTSLPRQLVIQDNRLHHPRYGAAPQGGGPVAISIQQGGGEYIIRHNDIYADPDHLFSDGMGEWRNFSFFGFPYRESDIYGNRISHCRGDAIEAEGGNLNVRIWGNHTEQVRVHLAAANTTLGPLYLWDNVAGAALPGTDSWWARLHDPAQLDESEEPARGQIFVFHNRVGDPAGPTRLLEGQHLYLRNNVLMLPAAHPDSALNRFFAGGRVDTDYNYLDPRRDWPAEAHPLAGPAEAGVGVPGFWPAQAQAGARPQPLLPGVRPGTRGYRPDSTSLWPVAATPPDTNNQRISHETYSSGPGRRHR